MKKLLLSIGCFLLGVVGSAYSAITISNDLSDWFGYDYQAPLTSHESVTIIIAIVSGILLILGFFDLIFIKSESNLSNRDRSSSYQRNEKLSALDMNSKDLSDLHEKDIISDNDHTK